MNSPETDRSKLGRKVEGMYAAMNALVERLDAALDPPRLLAELEVERLSAEEPDTARMLMLAAIPRILSIGILKVLEPGQDTAALERALARLQELGHVGPSIDGLRLHDAVRRALLSAWRDSANVEEYDGHATRLVTHFEKEFGLARQQRYHLRRAAPVLSAANPDRHVLIATRVEARLVGSIREAMYHAARLSARDLHELLVRQSAAVEEDGRVLDVAAHELDKLIIEGDFRTDRLDRPAVDLVPAKMQLWLEYWLARLQRQLGQEYLKGAEEVLVRISSESDDAELKQWSTADLGAVYESQYRLAEALQAYISECDLTEQSGVDTWNLATSYLRVGYLQQRLELLPAAEISLSRATRAAYKQDNPSRVIEATILSSQVLTDLGRWEEAAAIALDGLDASRRLPSARLADGLSLIDDLTTHDLITTGFMYLFRGADAELFYVVTHSCPVPRTFDSETTALLDRAQQLIEGGMFRQAKTILEKFPNEIQRPELQLEHGFRKAFLHESVGEWEEAIAVWDRMIEAALAIEREPWDDTAARSNRVQDLFELGRFEEVIEVTTSLAEGWSNFGFEAAAAEERALAAKAHVRLGHLDEARRILQGDTALAGEVPDLAMRHDDVRVDLAETTGALDEALGLLSKLAQSAEARLDHVAAAQLHARSAAQRVMRGAWSEAAMSADCSAELARRVQARDAWVTTKAQSDAANHGRRGIELLLEGTGDRRDDLDLARSELTQAITEHESSWYLLHRYYVSSELADWSMAVADLVRLTQLSPAWISERWLDKQLAAARAELDATSSGNAVVGLAKTVGGALFPPARQLFGRGQAQRRARRRRTESDD